MKRTGLGKGISALFSQEIGEENEMINLDENNTSYNKRR